MTLVAQSQDTEARLQVRVTSLPTGVHLILTEDMLLVDGAWWDGATQAVRLGGLAFLCAEGIAPGFRLWGWGPRTRMEALRVRLAQLPPDVWTRLARLDSAGLRASVLPAALGALLLTRQFAGWLRCRAG